MNAQTNNSNQTPAIRVFYDKIFLVFLVVSFVIWMAGSFAVHGFWLGDTDASVTSIMRPEEPESGLFQFMLLAHVLMESAFI